jgi:hypothetical protein
VPVWVWVLLFVFAWNDVMAFLSSPVTTSLNLAVVPYTHAHTHTGTCIGTNTHMHTDAHTHSLVHVQAQKLTRALMCAHSSLR